MKSVLFSMLFMLSIVFASCKKDKLVINIEKEFLQKDFIPSHPLFGGWRLNLSPNGNADIIPAGDIAFRGTYKIKGNSLSVETDQAGDFEFRIISETEIREKKYGVTLIIK